ncbi:uncharacterized protein LOC130668423 [Microplitis mediator]|uniref:uncharacterized protein LOC130668423 n=1 Tax=Microplitis mediator TaxID=375433 RepID=UPI002552CB0E|nr:uncharacterized protein LOC130668423 [Microplitis mediator]
MRSHNHTSPHSSTRSHNRTPPYSPRDFHSPSSHSRSPLCRRTLSRSPPPRTQRPFFDRTPWMSPPNVTAEGGKAPNGLHELNSRLHRCERELQSLKSQLLTKDLLENGIQRVLNTIEEKRQNTSTANLAPTAHAPVHEDGMDYLSALNAPDMRKRAIRVMSVF